MTMMMMTMMMRMMRMTMMTKSLGFTNEDMIRYDGEYQKVLSTVSHWPVDHVHRLLNYLISLKKQDELREDTIQTSDNHGNTGGS